MTIDRAVIGYIVNEERYPEGTVIIEEGSMGTWLYVVMEGQVKVRKKTDRGHVTVATLKEGAVFGEMVFLRTGKSARTATVVADGPALVGLLDSERLARDWQTVSPQLRRLISVLVDRLHHQTDVMTAMVEKLRPAKG